MSQLEWLDYVLLVDVGFSVTKSNIDYDSGFYSLTLIMFLYFILINLHKGQLKMAILVRGEITITKGFDTWKSMVKKNKHQMDEMGMVMLFAGVQKDDPTKLHTIMKFPNMEALQAFGANEELTEERKKAGAVVETGVMTMISENDFFTNFPEPFLSD